MCEMYRNRLLRPVRRLPRPAPNWRAWASTCKPWWGAFASDRLFAAADLDRRSLFLTNAVKHFKFEPRGKRRLHKTPHAGEIQACRWWLDAERKLVRPRVVVALGATAAMAVLGRKVSVLSERGRLLADDERTKAVVTVHPAYVLRVPDPAARETGRRDLVSDLRLAAAQIRS